MFFVSGSGRTMCATMGGMCIQCPLRIINQSVGRDASSRRGETLGNTAQFPPCGLSTAPAAAARHLRCQNAR